MEPWLKAVQKTKEKMVALGMYGKKLIFSKGARPTENIDCLNSV